MAVVPFTVPSARLPTKNLLRHHSESDPHTSYELDTHCDIASVSYFTIYAKRSTLSAFWVGSQDAVDALCWWINSVASIPIQAGRSLRPVKEGESKSTEVLLIMLFAHISQTCFSCLNDKITFAHSVCCHVYTGAYSRRIGLCQIDYCPLLLQLLSLWVGSVYQWCKCCLHCAISLRCYLRLPFLFIKWSLVFLLFFIFPSIIFLSCKSGCVLSMFDDV